MPGEQLDDQSLRPGGVAAGPPLHDDVAQLAHLVAGIVENREVPDPEMKTEVADAATGALSPRMRCWSA